jgi:hypothetical protein
MNVKRLPLLFLIFGVLLKALLVALSTVSGSPALVTLLTTYDPGAFAFANWGSSLFFDSRRIAPAPWEVQVFEALLVIAFGLECFLVGLVASWWFGRKTRHELTI